VSDAGWTPLTASAEISQMNRYFFHLTGQYVCEDREGEEFPTPEAAIAEAQQVAEELSQNRAESETRGWTLRVTDTGGAEIAVVTVSDGLVDDDLDFNRPPPDLSRVVESTQDLAA
jgi:hypothetical protein